MLAELAVSLGVLLVVWGYLNIKSNQNNGNLPPGPWLRLPIIGHLFFLGLEPHKTLLHWSKTYGPLVSVQMGSFTAVAINDAKLLKEAFKSPLTACRPKIKLFDDSTHRKGNKIMEFCQQAHDFFHLFHAKGIVFGEGAHGLEQRKFAIKTLKEFTSVKESIETRIINEAEDLVNTLKSKEGKHVSVHGMFNRNIVNTLMSVTFSHRYEEGDPEVDKLGKLIAGASQDAGLLLSLGIFFPRLCNWFPEIIGYNNWMRCGDYARAYFAKIVADRKPTHVLGEPRDILDAYFDKVQHTDDPMSSFYKGTLLKDTMRDFFVAALETTSLQLEWIIYYMTKYPEMQSKLQAELVANLDGREPTFSDRSKLPYTQAVIEEALRIATLAPLGLFHRTTQDFQIAGYHIPQDTVVIGNLYGINHDPDAWENPGEFMPERFLNDQGEWCPQEDKFVTTFSVGRRSCIGEELARKSLFYFTTKMFHKFNVRAVGKLPTKHIVSIMIAPAPFNVIFEQRS